MRRRRGSQKSHTARLWKKSVSSSHLPATGRPAKCCTLFLELLILTCTRCNKTQAAAPGANYAAVVNFLVPCFPLPCLFGGVPVSHSASPISAAEGIKNGGQMNLSEDAKVRRQMGSRTALQQKPVCWTPGHVQASPLTISISAC